LEELVDLTRTIKWNHTVSGYCDREIKIHVTASSLQELKHAIKTDLQASTTEAVSD